MVACSDNGNLLEIIYTNADSLTNKRDDLLLFLKSFEFKPSIIIITEVNSKNYCCMMESEFSIPEYKTYGTNIGVANFRGIIIYVHASLVACQVYVTSLFQECVVVQIRYMDKCMLTVGALYRSPSSNSANDDYLFELIDYLKLSVSGKLLIIGDCNFSDINWQDWSTGSTSSRSSNRFLNCLRKNFLVQHVMFPTRARSTQAPSLLDLVITNDYFIDEVDKFSPLGLSDHSILHVRCLQFLHIGITGNSILIEGNMHCRPT